MTGKLLGHTQVQTTARYVHLARDSIQNAAARITGSIGGNCDLLQSIEAILATLDHFWEKEETVPIRLMQTHTTCRMLSVAILHTQSTSSHLNLKFVA